MAKPFSELVAKFPQEEQDKIKEMSEQMIKDYKNSQMEGCNLIGSYAYFEDKVVFVTQFGSFNVTTGEKVAELWDIHTKANIPLTYSLGGGINLKDMSDYDTLVIIDRFFYVANYGLLFKTVDSRYIDTDGFQRFSTFFELVLFPCLVMMDLS